MIDTELLATQIKQWAKELGFQQAGISSGDLTLYENRLEDWLKNDYHGEMDYMK